MNLTVAIPTGDSIKAGTVSSLLKNAFIPGVRIRFDIRTGCYIHDSRNKLVDKAITSGSDYLMFIDSDIAFPAGAIEQLMRKDKDVIGGHYYKRQLPKTSAALIEENGRLVIPSESKLSSGGVIQVFAAPTGFLLIKTSVFRRIKTPWFWFGEYRGQILGEDAWFCKQCYEAGIPIYIDTSIPIKHIGNYLY